jgi:gamma-glutamyl:cysteine ligase YbdK (ATP-grasp superfamily)
MNVIVVKVSRMLNELSKAQSSLSDHMTSLASDFCLCLHETGTKERQKTRRHSRKGELHR